jgi:hypothetical protein|tara:strand:+ start:4781 stop:5161 length:381 start_codon:yes stop_codon:yes gene_type:complete
MDGVILATVPHTGTQFFTELLRPHLGSRLQVMHLTDGNWQDIKAHRGLTITTMRDWEKTLDSWRRRGRDVRQFPDCLRYWGELLTANPVVVSIDSDRLRRLQALSTKLSIPLETDWTPVNAWSGNG